MKSRIMVFFMLLLASAAFPFAVGGGNVSETDIAFGHNPAGAWSGIVGNINSSNPISQSLNVSPGEVAEINITFRDPYCQLKSIQRSVVLSLNKKIILPLSAGNLGQLDAYVNTPMYNASATFTRTGNLTLSSGTYENVPYTLTCGPDCSTQVFPTYYLQDSNNSFVFVGTVMLGSPGVFGPADYQMIVPTNGSNITYFIKADINYTCNASTVSPGSTIPLPAHALYIPPIESTTITIGDSAIVPIVVENAGEATESDIDVYAEGSLSSSHLTIPSLYVGDSFAGDLVLTPHGTGNLSATAIAKNGDTSASRKFNIIVLPICASDAGCTPLQYCSKNRCESRLSEYSPCRASDQCLSNLCANGMCSKCSNDAECTQSQVCAAGNCVEAPGGRCGYFSNHTFIPYQCCADTDCGALQQCSSHICANGDFTILQETIPTENETVVLTIVDGNGRPVANLRLVGGWVTDSNGQVTIIAPHDGNVCVIAAGNEIRCKRINVNLVSYGGGIPTNVSLVGNIYIEGLPIEGRQFTVIIRDTTGFIIPYVDMFINGNFVGKTDSNGRITLSMPKSGDIVISGEKLGYLVMSYTASIISKDRICDLPFRQYPVVPILDTYYPLLLVASFVFMALSFAITRRITKGGLLAPLASALIPAVVMALEGTSCGLFSSSIAILVSVAAFEYMALRHMLGGLGRKAR